MFDDDTKLNKSEFIIENKKDEEFFDIYLNENFYEKNYFFSLILKVFNILKKIILI